MPERGRRLGYVLKRYPRISETFVAAELIELERQGECVTVFALSRPQEPFEHAFVSELTARVVYLPHRPLREPLRTLRALVHVGRASRRGWWRAAAACLLPPSLAGLRELLQATVLRVELEQAEIDHVHAHFATSAARLANLVRRMGGPAYSVTAHAKDIYADGIRRDRLREKLVEASFVATVSEANATDLASILEARRPSVVHNSVDLRRLGRPDTNGGRKRDVVLSVARMIEKKGLSDLVAACGILTRRGVSPSWRSSARVLCVASSRRLRPATASVHRSLGPSERAGARALLAGGCLLPPLRRRGERRPDALPTSVLEAMALGNNRRFGGRATAMIEVLEEVVGRPAWSAIA